MIVLLQHPIWPCNSLSRMPSIEVKVIPGWDIHKIMDIVRDKSMFWHGIWKDCGKLQSGVIYSIMKKTRSTYHYMLRALKKRKYYITKVSLSKSMLRSNNGKYWKSASVLCQK